MPTEPTPADLAAAERAYTEAVQRATGYRAEHFPIFDQMKALEERVAAAKDDLMHAILAGEAKKFHGQQIKATVSTPHRITYDPHRLPLEVQAIPGVVTTQTVTTADKDLIENLLKKGIITEAQVAPARSDKPSKPSIQITFVGPTDDGQ